MDPLALIALIVDAIVTAAAWVWFVVDKRAREWDAWWLEVERIEAERRRRLEWRPTMKGKP
jgi:hypothetical protein